MEQQGNYFKCVCPFHNDHSPSLYIDERKQRFDCYVCNTGGNAFQFVMSYENVDFKTAYNKVVEIADLPKEFMIKVKRNKTYFPYSKKEEAKILMNERINEFLAYQSILNKPSIYLTNRNISKETIKTFQIGYLGSTEELIHYLQTKFKYTTDELIDNSFFIQKQNEVLSLFENRITIPIKDEFGKIVGFGGRAIDESGYLKQKYINSSASDIFDKKSLLFNFHNIQKNTKEKFIYIVEGYMDVVALHSVGISNAIALMGTALTQERIDKLKSIKNYRLVWMLDGDQAGRKAMRTSIRMCMDNDIRSFCVVLPQDMDPDDVIQKEENKFSSVIQNYHYDFEYELIYQKEILNIETLSYPLRKQYALEQLKQIYSQKLDIIDTYEMLSRISSTFAIPESAIKQQYQQMLKEEQALPIQGKTKNQASTRYAKGRLEYSKEK